MHFGIDFCSILVGLGPQLGAKKRSKIGPKSDLKKVTENMTKKIDFTTKTGFLAPAAPPLFQTFPPHLGPQNPYKSTRTKQRPAQKPFKRKVEEESL